MTQEDVAAFVARVLVDTSVVGFVLTYTRHGTQQYVAWVLRRIEGVLIEEYLI